jgi:hypothetical protein
MTSMPSRKPAVDLERLEAVRLACIQAALDAYEDAGLRGLCGEGRWELAIDAMRRLDVRAFLDRREPADAAGRVNRA